MSAAISAQEANDRLTQAFKNQGLAITANSPAVSKLLASQRKLGVSNADTRESLLKLINSGKDYKLSVDEMGVALNLARTSGISLGDATKSLVTLQAGSVRSAKQFGIVLPPVTKNVDALKDSHVKLTTQEGRHLLALAKVQDKLATGRAYYDALSQKVKDQGAAFAGTAAGGIAQFHAQLGFLEEQLGAKLLPMFNQLLAWVSAHWPEISAIMAGAVTGVGAAIKGMVTAVQAIIPVVAAVVDWVKQNWPQISATFMEVFNTVKSIVSSAVSIITALWNQFGVTILAQLRATWTFVQTYLSGVFNVIRGIFNVFAGLLSGDWSRVWLGLQQIFSGIWQQMTAVIRLALATIVNLLTAAGRLMLAAVQGPWNAIRALATTTFNGVVSAVTGAVGRAISAATAVGAGILHGVSNGLTGLVLMVQGWFQSLWAWIAGAARSAYAFALNVGRQLVQGILDGLTSAAHRLWDAAGGLVDGVRKKLEFWHSPPSEYGKWLGTELVKGITDALKGGAGAAGNAAGNFVTSIKGPLLKGMNTVGQLIVAAAKKYGVDARAALAVAMGEGGIKFGAVGDSGHAFGPFQMNNAGGVLTGMDSAAASKYANSVEGINAALRGMREAGAAGKVGLDAITTIISKYERPLNVAASIQNAIAAYKTLGPGIASAVASGAPAVSGAIMRQLSGLAALVRQYAPIIGLEHARGIVAGLVAGTPTLVQQARAQMVAAAAAARQAVVDAKGAFISAFNDLANAALTAFDTRWAAWVPPAQRLLDKMQLAEQVKQVQDQLATAMTAVTGGGAFDASVLSKQLGESLATAMSTAIGSIAGAKTEEALNRVSAQVQTQVLAAIDQTSAAAMAQAQAAVAAAQTALTAAQTGGDPDAVAAAQAALDTAVGNQNTLEAAILAEKELALGQLVASETKRHEAIGATQREGLAKQLAELRTELAKHPGEWNTMGANVQKILADYSVRLQTAGRAWADKFGDGIRAGIPAAVAAAHALADAVAAILPSTSSPLKPAKKGPLAFHPRDMGKAWASNFASGLASGRIGNIVGSLTGAPMVGGGGMVAAGAGGGLTVNFHIGTVVGDADAFARQATPLIRRELARDAARNVGLALG